MLSALVSQSSADHSVIAFFPSYGHSKLSCMVDLKNPFEYE